MQTYYIYFMTCKNGKALYVGVTNNLEKRVIHFKIQLPQVSILRRIQQYTRGNSKRKTDQVMEEMA